MPLPDPSRRYPVTLPDGAERMTGYQPDTRDTLIGHDVWIGYGAMILPGAQIGSGAIIGAGSVVRGKVPPYAIVTGIPAEVRRFRFGEDTINRLLALSWWEWPAELIAEAEGELLAEDIEELERIAPK